MTAYSIGEPVTELPGTRRERAGAARWEAVAEAVRARPGLWFPIELPAHAPKTRAQIASRVRLRTPGAPKALKQPGFDAAYRMGVLYIRYDPAAES